jgi:hypothetical protein
VNLQERSRSEFKGAFKCEPELCYIPLERIIADSSSETPIAPGPFYCETSKVKASSIMACFGSRHGHRISPLYAYFERWNFRRRGLVPPRPRIGEKARGLGKCIGKLCHAT